MKDLIKKISVILIFWIFLTYLVYLLINKESITTPEYARFNIPMYIILIWICIYMVFIYWIYPVHFKLSRAASLVIGLLLIVLSQILLANDWYSHIYVWDLFSVLWVVILILFPTNIMTTDKVKKAKEKKNEIIIEV